MNTFMLVLSTAIAVLSVAHLSDYRNTKDRGFAGFMLAASINNIMRAVA
jgi:hypothetical protein